MPDADRMRADAEDAEVFSEMARSRLRFAVASRAALVQRWKDAQEHRVCARRRQSSEGEPSGGRPQAGG